jgi:hypothetical protein
VNLMIGNCLQSPSHRTADSLAVGPILDHSFRSCRIIRIDKLITKMRLLPSPNKARMQGEKEMIEAHMENWLRMDLLDHFDDAGLARAARAVYKNNHKNTLILVRRF